MASSSVFAFILSENVLDSLWCVAELTAAVDSGVPVVVVKKEGSRWRDPNTGAYRHVPRAGRPQGNSQRVQQVFQIKSSNTATSTTRPSSTSSLIDWRGGPPPGRGPPLALTAEELEGLERGGRPRLRHMLSMMDGAAGRRPSLDGRSLDRRSFDEYVAVDEPRLCRRAPARSS